MKRIKTSLALAIIALSFMVAFSRTASAQGETFVSIINAVDGTYNFNFTSTTPVGTVFTANLTVTNVLDLAAWQFNITYDPELLNVTSDDQLVIPTDNVFGQYADQFVPDKRDGMVFWGAGISLSGPDSVNVTGTGTLCQINFTVIKNNVTASTQLHLVVVGEYPIYTDLINTDAESIPFTPKPGYYYIPEFNLSILLALFAITSCAVLIGRKALIGKRIQRPAI